MTPPAPTPEILTATLRGARSVHVRGWLAEECESAALERLARHPCEDPARAYTQGRNAAIDELRALTHHRRDGQTKVLMLSWPTNDSDEAWEVPVGEPGYDRADLADAIDRVTKPRLAEIMRMFAAGSTAREVGERFGLTESRISQIVHRDLRRSARYGIM